MKALNHPFESFRPSQVKAIDSCFKAIKDGKKYIVLEAPTGAGKSGIAVELLRKLGGGRILTSQIALQNQYKQDYSEFSLLKGAKRYSCDMSGPPTTVPTKKGLGPAQPEDWTPIGYKTHCGEGQKYMHKYFGTLVRCGYCPYSSAVDSAIKSAYSIVNYYAFYYQNKMRNGVLNDTNLVLDEAHNLNKVTTSLYTRTFPETSGFTFVPPRDDQCRGGKQDKGSIGLTDKQYVHDCLQDYLFYVDNAINFPSGTSDSKKKVERLKEKRREAEFQLKHCKANYFVYSFEEELGKRVLTCTPIDVRLLARKVFYEPNKVIIFMSATILDLKVFCKEAGVLLKDVFHCRVADVFPPVNHRVKYTSSPVNMSFKHRQTALPSVVRQIKSILASHPNQKGVIHGQTYDICKYVAAHCKSNRLTFSEKVDKALVKHSNKPYSVLLSPAVKEGISFAGPESEFQILLCVPYPVFNIHAEEKIKINGKFYHWEACVDFIQSLGRSVRSPADTCVTYLVDIRFHELIMNIRKNGSAYLKTCLPEAPSSN